MAQQVFLGLSLQGKLMMNDIEVAAQKTVEEHLHKIVDEVHPLFQSVSDENLVEDYEDHGVFERIFAQLESGKLFKMRWRVYYGTPETVKTVFEPAEHLGFVS
jgi:hypothetical protein